MEEDSDDISFVEEGEEEDVVTQLRRTSRPSNNTDGSTDGADPLLSGINMSGANSWQVTAAAKAEQLRAQLLNMIHASTQLVWVERVCCMLRGVF
jgi:hypothetical protein